MSSLLTEYRNRHGISSIWPINEGVLFFSYQGKPNMVCLTSSYTKSVHTCGACRSNSDGITMELFHHSPASMTIKAHVHMPPDGDLLEYVQRHTGTNEMTPYVSNGERDQERWLWDFYLQTNPLNGSNKWSRFIQKQLKSKASPNIAFQEQAMFFIQNYGSRFTTFYNSIYSLCMIGRKYILVK